MPRQFGMLALAVAIVASAIGLASAPLAGQHPLPTQPVHPVAPAQVKPGIAQQIAPKAEAPKKHKRGLKPTPRGKIATAKRFVPPAGKALPTSVAYVPKQMSYWLNDQVGDCVTAEEAFNQDCIGVFIQDSTVQTWASQYGFLDGAMLTDVMDQMAKSGFKQGGNTYGVGPYTQVNFSDEPTLQAAIAIAPVKIGIDANALPSGAGNQMGWYATGGTPGEFSNEDHCVSLCGYGTAQVLFSAVGSAVPASIQPSTPGYLLFTWNTIGFVDHAWIMSTTAEAYLRNPTATLNGNPQPNPGPQPNPNPPTPPTPTPPTPPVPPGPLVPYTGTLTFQNGVLMMPQSSGGGVQQDLANAGVSPMVIVDVLQLLADLKAKAGIAVIAQDVLKVIADLSAPATPAPAPAPKEKAGRREEAMNQLAA